jgi:hypothetical protein
MYNVVERHNMQYLTNYASGPNIQPAGGELLKLFSVRKNCQYCTLIFNSIDDSLYYDITNIHYCMGLEHSQARKVKYVYSQVYLL